MFGATEITEMEENTELNVEEPMVVPMMDIPTIDPNDFQVEQVVADSIAIEQNLEHFVIGVQAAVGTVINTENVDLLYVTSISFLFVLTIAILSAIVQYRNSKYLHDLSNKGCLLVVSQSQRQRNGKPHPNEVNGTPAAGMPPRETEGRNPGVLEQAFDQLTDPTNYNIFGALKLPFTVSSMLYEKLGRRGDGGAIEENRLRMDYSSAN